MYPIIYLNLYAEIMIHYKPTPQAVEPKGAPVKIHKITTKTLVMNLDGTVSLPEDHRLWDNDKPNRLGE